MKRRILYILLLLMFAKAGMGITPTLNLITGSPAPFINCGLIKFNVSGYPSDANYYRLEVYSDASFSTSPIFISEPKYIYEDALSDKSGYFRAVFFNSADNQIYGFDANYINELIVRPNPVITSSPSISLPNFVYGRTSILTASTTPKAINPWEINLSSYISIASNPDPKKINIEAILVGGPSEIKFTDINGCFKTISLNVIKRPLTITVNALDKVYNGNNSAPSATLTSDQIFSDDVYFNFTSSTFDNKNIGSNKTVTVSGISISSGTDAGNYTLTSSTAIGSASITARSITISAINSDKEYDGTVSSTGVPNIIAGSLALNDDEVFIQTYNTKNKGNNKILTPSVVSILDASSNSMIGNYSITYESISNGVITAKQLTTADPVITKTKEYDKTVAANVTAGALSGVVSAGSLVDAVTVSAVGTYNTSTVGTAKTITVVYGLEGADKDNYLKPADKVYTDGVITAKQLIIADPVITKTKEYDKTVAANATAGALSGVVSAGSLMDAVTVSAVGTYKTSTVGTAKTITVVYSLEGADKNNYIKPVDKIYTDGEISKKPIVVKAVATDKIFDGNKNVTVTLSSVDIFSTDDVIISKLLAEFDSKDPGTNKTVTVTGINLGGVDAFNYNLTNTTATAIASITGAITSSVRPFVLPNAFTPNGDTKNTEFKFIVNDPSKITLRLFQIFNRNGKLMFSTNDISKGWDGRYNGVIQDMGVYFVKYRIDINGAPSSVDTVPFYLLK